MRKRTTALLTFMVILVSFSIYTFFSDFRFSFTPSVVKVYLNFYDYSTGAAIKGLAVNFNMTTRSQDVFTATGVSDENGRIVKTLPEKDIEFPVSAENISFSGSWVLEKTVGEETLSIADQKWVAIDPTAFLSNTSKYTFDEVRLFREQDGSALNLRLDFYLAPGRLIGIYNPILEARRMDYRLRINYLNCNFVEFAGVNYAVVPIGSPLIADFQIDYYMLHFVIHVSVDVGNRTFIDLTPVGIRAISSAQIRELTRGLDNLKPYGFELTDQYNEISKIATFYDLAAIAIEKQDYDSFRIYVQSAVNSCRDLHEEIVAIYGNAFGLVPGLLAIFQFFALSLSKLITNRKDLSIILFVILFSAVFFLFFFTQPYLMLVISNPLILIQSFTVSVISYILILLLFFSALLLFMVLHARTRVLSYVKSFIWETFEVGVRNLKRRKLKTVLALLTVLIISASSMCFLTITNERFTFQRLYPRLNLPLVQDW